MVLSRQFGADAGKECDRFLRESYIDAEPVALDHAILARDAFLDFGNGRQPAGLNFGDCLSYALAKAYREPLLLKGNDFSKTDLLSAA
jgi:ribonuclease VapC